MKKAKSARQNIFSILGRLNYFNSISCISWYIILCTSISTSIFLLFTYFTKYIRILESIESLLLYSDSDVAESKVLVERHHHVTTRNVYMLKEVQLWRQKSIGSQHTSMKVYGMWKLKAISAVARMIETCFLVLPL